MKDVFLQFKGKTVGISLLGMNQSFNCKVLDTHDSYAIVEHVVLEPSRLVYPKAVVAFSAIAKVDFK